jgi:flagellar hook-length control protein FliK
MAQQLLAPPPLTGDQIATDLMTQLDRAAGAGTTETKDAGMPVDGDMLVALMPQIALSAETQVVPPSVVLSVADASGRLSGGRGKSMLAANQALPATAAEAAQGGLVRAAGGDAPRVVLPSAAADAPRAATAPVMVPEGEQQHALPLARTAIDVEAPPVVAPDAAKVAPDAAKVAPPAAAEVELPVADGADGANLAELVTVDPVVPDAVEPSARRQSGPVTGEAVAEAVAPASPPVKSSTRSTTPVSATEPTVTPLAAEAFTADLAGTVRRASLLGDREVRLLLNPPELGTLDVRVVDSPNGLRVVLEATTAEARQLIEQQLPLLRSALESRDLRVERLSVEQSIEASSEDQDLGPGLRQHAQGGDGSEQSGQDAAPWSPVASIQSDHSGELAAAGRGNRSETSTHAAASDGRLNVLA